MRKERVTMDGILALGHFCESHGPCVILCTQRAPKKSPNDEEPQKPHSPQNLTVPVCGACQTIDLKQAIISKDNKFSYITTRTPLQQQTLAHLLKQAVVRSLSCEETSEDGGTLYFGDNERGHVISHIFRLQDSLARGFRRKYCILMFMQDKIHLLNCWSFLTRHIKRIAEDLQEKSMNVNNLEQMHKSQRAVRQAQNSPLSDSGRSLGELTGEPGIFAHIHLWFTWLLSAETCTEIPHKPPDIPVNCQGSNLREIFENMPLDIFHTLCYCYLTGIKVDSDDPQIEPFFRQLLPLKFQLPKTGEVCRLYKPDNRTYKISWNGTLPQKLPQLIKLIENALKNDNFKSQALESHITSLIMQWYNISCVISWTPNNNNNNNSELLKSLGVQKFDMPLLSYWVPQCKD